MGNEYLGGVALPSDEVEVILRVAKRSHVDPRLLAAIRLAENGGPGREFGCFSNAYPRTFEGQAQCAADTISANELRAAFQDIMVIGSDGRYTEDFLRFLGERYAPIGADNDPGNLNANWIPNVLAFYARADVSVA